MKISEYLKHTTTGIEKLRCMPSTFIIINNFRNSCKSHLINMCNILTLNLCTKIYACVVKENTNFITGAGCQVVWVF